MITYQCETWDEFWPDFLAVWETEHRPEVQGPESKARVNYDLYEEHITIIFTARDNRKLVGYVVTLVLEDTPFMDDFTAYTAFYFVCQAYRGQGIARELFRRTETELPGEMYVYTATKARVDHSGFLKRIGYEDCEIMLRKKITW